MELLFILAAVLLIEMTAEHEQKLLDYRNCYIYSLPQEVRYHFPASLFGAVFKRLFDIIVSLAVLLTVFPLIFLIAAPLIKLTSSGPIFFTQKRLGLYAELFDCYKFRTMYTNPGAEPVRKNDSRVTPVGRFLRKTHLDEFPQCDGAAGGGGDDQTANAGGKKSDGTDRYAVCAERKVCSEAGSFKSDRPSGGTEYYASAGIRQ